MALPWGAMAAGFVGGAANQYARQQYARAWRGGGRDPDQLTMKDLFGVEDKSPSGTWNKIELLLGDDKYAAQLSEAQRQTLRQQQASIEKNVMPPAIAEQKRAQREQAAFRRAHTTEGQKSALGYLPGFMQEGLKHLFGVPEGVAEGAPLVGDPQFLVGEFGTGPPDWVAQDPITQDGRPMSRQPWSAETQQQYEALAASPASEEEMTRDLTATQQKRMAAEQQYNLSRQQGKFLNLLRGLEAIVNLNVEDSRKNKRIKTALEAVGLPINLFDGFQIDGIKRVLLGARTQILNASSMAELEQAVGMLRGPRIVRDAAVDQLHQAGQAQEVEPPSPPTDELSESLLEEPGGPSPESPATTMAPPSLAEEAVAVPQVASTVDELPMDVPTEGVPPDPIAIPAPPRHPLFAELEEIRQAIPPLQAKWEKQQQLDQFYNLKTDKAQAFKAELDHLKNIEGIYTVATRTLADLDPQVRTDSPRAAGRIMMNLALSQFGTTTEGKEFTARLQTAINKGGIISGATLIKRLEGTGSAIWGAHYELPPHVVDQYIGNTYAPAFVNETVKAFADVQKELVKSKPPAQVTQALNRDVNRGRMIQQLTEGGYDASSNTALTAQVKRQPEEMAQHATRTLREVLPDGQVTLPHKLSSGQQALEKAREIASVTELSSERALALLLQSRRVTPTALLGVMRQTDASQTANQELVRQGVQQYLQTQPESKYWREEAMRIATQGTLGADTRRRQLSALLGQAKATNGVVSADTITTIEQLHDDLEKEATPPNIKEQLLRQHAEGVIPLTKKQLEVAGLGKKGAPGTVKERILSQAVEQGVESLNPQQREFYDLYKKQLEKSAATTTPKEEKLKDVALQHFAEGTASRKEMQILGKGEEAYVRKARMAVKSFAPKTREAVTAVARLQWRVMVWGKLQKGDEPSAKTLQQMKAVADENGTVGDEGITIFAEALRKKYDKGTGMLSLDYAKQLAKAILKLRLDDKNFEE